MDISKTPWKHVGLGSTNHHKIMSADGLQIAGLPLIDEGKGLAADNAKLMAAAPELLLALTRAMETLSKYGSRESNPDEEAWGAFTQAASVIAKVSA